jgi:hypothetical protein
VVFSIYNPYTAVSCLSSVQLLHTETLSSGKVKLRLETKAEKHHAELQDVGFKVKSAVEWMIRAEFDTDEVYIREAHDGINRSPVSRVHGSGSSVILSMS